MTQKNKISLKWQKVHVFISSTFNDMHAERDYLVKQIFPQLQEWCEKRKLRLVDIDLRWGVTEQDALYNKNALKVCLDRIDECRPFFLCFLGQRRGWVPKKEEISSETFELFPELKTFAGKTSITEMEILHALINPLHQGKPRNPGKPDEYYERVKHAFFYLRDSSYLDKVPSSPPLLRQTYTNEGVEDPRERQIHEQELENWREVKIKKESNRPVHSYEARWDSSAVAPELALPLQCPSSEPINIERWRQQWAKTGTVPASLNIEDNPPEAEKAKNFNKQLCIGRLTDFKSDGMPLSQVIIEDLQEAIANRYPDHIEVVDQPDLQKEIDQQEQFLFVNSEGFIERGDDFAELDDYVENDSNKLYVLTAPGGMGKSMLLANWVDRCRTKIESRKEESIHFRFIGASDRSTTVYSLLRFLLLEMKEIEHKFDKDIPEDPEELRKVWPELLDAVSKRGKTIIVIDALNQLESGLSDLNWLPWQLPSNIKLIVSFKRGEQKADELYKRFSKGGQVILSKVRPFENPDDRRKLVQAYLAQYLKDIDKQHLETLIKSQGASNPLYLKVVLSELRVFGAFASLEEKIRKDFGETPVSAFQGVLTRLESDPAYSPIHPGQAVPLLFGLFAHARHGLSADELTRLFIQALNKEDTREQREIAADTINLFLRQVRPFLAHREGRYDFFFESFKNAVEECYVAKSSDDKSPKRLSSDWHRMLAVYFASLPKWQEETSLPKGAGFHDRIPTIRKVSELAYHQAWAGMEELVETLTDFSFMDAKLLALGIYPLIEDYDLALIPMVREKVNFSENSLRLIQGALRLSAHILARDKQQLRCQLCGRLMAHNQLKIKTLVDLDIIKQWKDGPWLCTLSQSLTSPGGPLIRTLEGHTGGVFAVSVLPDGNRAISGSSDSTLKVWDLEKGEVIKTLQGHTDSVRAVSVLPDGKRAISGSSDSTLKVWDLEKGEVIKTLQGHTDSVRAVSVLPDGKRAISGSSDSTLKVWDLEKGEVIKTLRGHTGNVNDVSVLPDGKRAISGSDDMTLKVWDLEKGEVIKTLKDHTSFGYCGREVTHYVTAVSVLPDGKRAISGSSDSTLKVWDLEKGEVIKTLQQGLYNMITDVSVLPDGKTAISVSIDNTQVWDLEKGEVIKTLQDSWVFAVSVLPDGKRAISGSSDSTLKVWGLEKEEVIKALQGHDGSVTAVSVLPDGKRAISGSSDSTLKVWDLEKGEVIKTLQGHDNSVEAVSVLPDGKRAISWSSDDTIKVWDMEKGEVIKTLQQGLCEMIIAVSVLPDGKRAISGSMDYALKVWDLEKGEVIKTLRGHTDTVWAVSVLPDGKRVISGSKDTTLKVWDLEKGEVMKTLQGHIEGVGAVSVLPDGKRAISGSWDNTLKVWDLEKGEVIQTLKGHIKGVRAVTVLPDGKRAISGSDDMTLKVWDLEKNVAIASFSGDSALNCITSTPDGKIIIAGESSGRVHFLRLENVVQGPPIVTAWNKSDQLLVFGCLLCHTWSEIPTYSLGKEISCPHCGKPVRLNPYTIKTDWRSVAKAWVKKPWWKFW